MRRTNRTQLIGLIILAVILVVVPFRVGLYYVDVMIMLFINILIAVSFRVMATTGEFSLAQIPLVGVGAYATAIMTKTFGLPFGVTLLMAGLMAALIGLAMSYPLTKTKGFPFLIASFAAGEAMRLSWIRLRVPFGGHQGIQNIAPPSFVSIPGLPTIDFGDAIPYYFLTLGVTVLCLLVMYWLDRSRLGTAFKAIHSQDDVAGAVGIPVIRYKMMAFVITSFFAGIAGALLAHRLWAIDPQQFGFTTTLYLIVWVVVGGYGTFAGPIIGVSVLAAVDEVLRPLAEWMPMIYGLILILTLRFLPDGLESLRNPLPSLMAKISRIRRKANQ